MPRRLVLRRGENQSDALFRLLRSIARSCRAAQDQTFYSLREIGGQFELSLSLVSRVFARLEKEGLLGRIRGSRTVLHGKKFDRHLYVRGVVGIPVSIFRFAAFTGYREFVTQLRGQLRQRGFMPAAIFYRPEESRSDFLRQCLFEAKADAVIWLSPRREARETVSSLRDADIRVIGVSDSVTTAIPCRYQASRENALRHILRDWRAAGLKRTVVVTAERGGSPADEESYRRLSGEELLPSQVVTLDASGAQRLLWSVARSVECGVLLTQSAAAFLATGEAEMFARLAKQRRVALVEGPISVAFAPVPAVPVDLVVIDWEKVAERIVTDLIAQTAWSASDGVIFNAASRLRIPLPQCCQRL